MGATVTGVVETIYTANTTNAVAGMKAVTTEATRTTSAVEALKRQYAAMGTLGGAPPLAALKAAQAQDAARAARDAANEVRLLQLNAEGATGGVRGLTGALSKMEGAAGFLFKLGAAGFGIQMLARLTGSIISVGAEAENSALGVSTLLWNLKQTGAVTGLKDFPETLRYGAAAMEELNRMAAVGVGETQDYIRGFQGLVLSVVHAGGDISNVLEMTRELVPLAAAFNTDVESAALGVMKLLSGRVLSSNRFIQSMGLEAMQEVAKTARSDPRAALMELRRLMLLNREAGAYAGTTWEGVFSTLVDTGKVLLRDVMLPLLPVFKTAVEMVTKFLNAAPVQAALWVFRQLASIIGGAAKGVGILFDILTQPLVALGKWIGASDKDTSRKLSDIKSVSKTAEEAVGSMRRLGEMTGETADGMGAVSAEAGAAAGQVSALGTAASNAASELRNMGTVGDFGSLEDTLQTLRRSWSFQTRGFTAEGEALGAGVRLPVTQRMEALSSEWSVYMDALVKDLHIHAALIPTTLEEALKSDIPVIRNAAIEWSKAFNRAIISSIPTMSFLEATWKAWRKEGEGSTRTKPVVNIQKVEVKMDARHADPDRMVAMFVDGLGRTAMRRVGSRFGVLHGTGR